MSARVDLIAMSPDVVVASTGYALVNPGVEYLVLQTDGRPFTVALPPGPYQVDWFAVTSRTDTAGDVLT
ncbi:MAG TPA: hypothetical protein VH573_02265, partial [Mycobacteriales bacterium]